MSHKFSFTLAGLAATSLLTLASSSIYAAEAKTTTATTPTTNTQLTAANDAPAESVKDPYEGFNRAMFTFNDKLDKYFMKPIATGYNTIMPKPLNQGVHNFFLNIGNFPNIANDLLQANFYQATNDTWRLIINSTIGVAGFFDMATRMGLQAYQNDFGLTLARWGYQNSNYLVLPFFGPNTVRDGIGIPVDYYAFSVYPHIHPAYWRRYGIYALGVVDRRAQLLQFQDVMDEAAVDRYVFVRDAYMQRRAYLIKENNHRGCLDQLNGVTGDDSTTGSDATATKTTG